MPFYSNHNILCLQVNFAITAYNACKEFSATYNDTLVDATSNIVKKEALDSLISCFRDGGYRLSNV